MDRAIAVTNYSDLNEYNKLELKKKKSQTHPVRTYKGKAWPWLSVSCHIAVLYSTDNVNFMPLFM